MKPCDFCGHVDEYYDEGNEAYHEHTPKHIANKILKQYAEKRKNWGGNREGIIISCEARVYVGEEFKTLMDTPKPKIRACAKPNQKIKFLFSINNDTREDDMLLVGIQLGHPQPQFEMNNHPYIFGGDPHVLEKKSSIAQEVSVTFQSTDVARCEMPIFFTFVRMRDSKNLIFVREMLVTVEENPAPYQKMKNYYKEKEWQKADHIIQSINHVPFQNNFKIPRLLKILLPRGLEERALEGIKTSREELEKLREILLSTRYIMDEGITPNNYMIFFRHLLWWEEVIGRINLRKYNMVGVTLEKIGHAYVLLVPGLAEKRPSLLRGDRVYIRPQANEKVIFESVIKELEDDRIRLVELDETFDDYYHELAQFDIKFMMCRVPMERMHDAVSKVFTSKQQCRAFPQPVKKPIQVYNILKFYNKLISQNEEQKSAVEHIVSGTSGRAPYIVFGPPGTGKTMTIVEAIIQLVVKNSRNRILVCTDSNMASDHIALMLLQYNKKLNINNFILRANSQSREWTVMPSALAAVSNGTKYENCKSITNTEMASYRIVVMTLSHAAKYATPRSQQFHKLQVSHLFIDEAAQASEPCALIPVTGLLAPKGQLVLAGDPRQLGPVCISKEAARRGLGKSLLQRLKENYENLYENDPNYITMLVKNFRNHPDILEIPNNLFYDGSLQPLAKIDPLSTTSILDIPGGDRAIVFHSVNSMEQRMGKTPSYFNDIEIDMVKKYVFSLVEKFKVQPDDIGIIAPYIRQVYKIKAWLTEQNYENIQVGTVESFQGKEKRVILVSTVRANCKLLDYDAKYGLGFLVDDKRFNVTLTRAKAKIVIIGNAACLTRDIKWRIYMDKCRELNCYLGRENEQLERSSQLLTEITTTRFKKIRIREELKLKEEKEKKP